jgi:hypothetical protein
MYTAIVLANASGLHNNFEELSLWRSRKMRSHMSTWNRVEFAYQFLGQLDHEAFNWTA